METATSTPSLEVLRACLPGLMPLDRSRLARRGDKAAALTDPQARERALRQVLTDAEAAQAKVEARQQSVPVITYPPELPVSQRREQIAAAIAANQVVIVAGETGSGKTTQLPKICLELGRGVAGQIGHTQPRRIAARTVAERIAAELGTELGSAVGYKVRFTDNSSDGTLVKVMTDGILLTEMQRDRQLLRYDTLIIDEAHERSLNIDFILGYLKRLLPSRPDLKVIITSATIDPERFSRHFAPVDAGGAEADAGGVVGGPAGLEGRRARAAGRADFTAAGGGDGAGAGAGGSTGAGGNASTDGSTRADGSASTDGSTGAGGNAAAGGSASAGGNAGAGGGDGSGNGAGGAPVIEVSGRMYPVEVRYRPLTDPSDRSAEPRDQVQGICDAVDELIREGPGDILVFLSGEREIADTADALSGRVDLEVLPLYARLSTAEQHRVFQPHRGRRVVLATNVAETSLTVPGIKYVIDPGTARISRYSHRTKVQRLPIEPVSQASANQRKGRCGRTSDGVCIRLYSEEDFASRPEFTDPEITRTNLASVILRMAALDLGEVAEFPFVDPPDSRNVSDGIRLLAELGAMVPGRGGRRLTGLGRKLAQLPLDPRLGRMILEAGRAGCAREVLVITAALSINDPRERPAEAREAASALHARFAEPGSDFLAYLVLWDYLRERQRELSSSAFRRLCRREYLHYLRVREWQDLYAQLRQAARDAGVSADGGQGPLLDTATVPAVTPAATGAGPSGGGNRDGGTDAAGRAESPQQARVPADLASRVHTCLLAGLLSHIGLKEPSAPTRGKRRPLTEFAGARGAHFAIFPDSVLAKKPPQWVVAAELVETSRLWGRTVARIEPGWVEPLAGHLVTRTYSEPHWDARRGAAMALEKVSLFGLPLVTERPVNFGRIDPAAAREIFIRHALVDGEWRTHHRFFHENQRLLAEAEETERRARRRGLVADSNTLFRFYNERVPADVISTRHFDTWWKKARAAEPGLLTFSPADLAGPASASVEPADYPDSWGEYPLSYEFAPGDPGDGISVDIPLTRLNQVRGEDFGWLVPGLREELVTELIRTLPKHLRRLFVPAPNAAREVLARLDSAGGDLLTTLGTELGRLGGVTIPRDAWDISRLPPHLRMTFRVMDGGQVLAAGKDLAELRGELRPRLQAALTEAARGLTRSGLRDWDFGPLPRVFDHGQVRAYPALADAGDHVDIRLFDTPAQAEESMLAGTRRLLLLRVPSGVRAAATSLPGSAKLAISAHPYPGIVAFLDDCAACAADQVITDAGGPPRDADGFARLVTAAHAGLRGATARVVADVARVLAEAHQAQLALAASPAPPLAPAFADLREQVAALVYPGFVARTGAHRLPALARYLKAVNYRLDKLPESPSRDAQRMAIVHRVTGAYETAMADLAAAGRRTRAALDVRWLIEELRVSLFAQSLGTPVPVSERRIESVLDRLTG